VDFVARHCPSGHPPPARVLRVSLRRQLAAMTQRMHAAGFYHHDLVWRNILVTWNPPQEPKLWWIDCPRGQFDRWSPRRRRRGLKDLASLDKSAVKFCTLGERVAFVRDYLGRRRLDDAAKQFLRAVRDYRRDRWPEDWPGR
jgi:tRNA A-37 threonylcarbamoyl transferase component Bud32